MTINITYKMWFILYLIIAYTVTMSGSTFHVRIINSGGNISQDVANRTMITEDKTRENNWRDYFHYCAFYLQ